MLLSYFFYFIFYKITYGINLYEDREYDYKKITNQVKYSFSNDSTYQFVYRNFFVTAEHGASQNFPGAWNKSIGEVSAHYRIKCIGCGRIISHRFYHNHPTAGTAPVADEGNDGYG